MHKYELIIINGITLQDKNVAFKIFELGLKKYGQFADYILAYVDYMSHINGMFRVILHCDWYQFYIHLFYGMFSMHC